MKISNLNKNVDHLLRGLLNLTLVISLPLILMYFAYQNAITEYESKMNNTIINEITKHPNLM